MNKCAQIVISDYLGNPPRFKFSDLDTDFTGEDGFHFIKNGQTASYAGSVGTTSDGKVVKSYTQFRNNNGSQAHWLDFESICTKPKIGYTIKRKWTIYKFDTIIDKVDPTGTRVYQLYDATSSTKIDKVDPTGTIKLNKLTVPCISSNCINCPLNGGCASSNQVILNCSCPLKVGKSGDRCASAKSEIIR